MKYLLTLHEEMRKPPAYFELHSLVRRDGIERKRTVFFRPCTNEVLLIVETREAAQ